MKHLFFLFTFGLCSLFSHEILVFYHLPKCGGTTIASLLGEKFDVKEIYHHVVNKETSLTPLQFEKSRKLELDRFDPEKVKYIHGHIVYIPEVDLPEAKNITFLRDPVERVFSAYRYVNQYRKVDFFELYRIISNSQVHRLSGLPKADPTISLQEHLESAKRVLAEKFFFVGIMEKMEASLGALYKLLNWEPLTLTPKFNITVKKEPLDPALSSFVYQEEWADRELYEFAKTLFQQHLEKSQGLLTTVPPVSLVDTIRFAVDQPLDGEGWGYRELDLETNTKLRQSYTQDAFLRFPLLKRDYKMKFKACFPHRKMQNDFRLFVNGKKIDCQCSGKGKWKTFKAFIPKEFIREKKTTFTFHVPSLYAPSEHQNVPDHRKMGVGIAEILIKPE